MRYARQQTDITATTATVCTRTAVKDKTKPGNTTKKGWGRTELKPKRKGILKNKNMAMAMSKFANEESNSKMEVEDEINRLRDEIEQENQMKLMLDQSKLELDKTVEQLINKYQGNEIEDNEWKTRYQTQCQINEQLEKQRIMLQDKLQNFRESTKSGNHQMQKKSNKEELSDVEIRKLMKQLDREKRDLEGQLNDLEWRLNNESRSFHKLEEDRKMYVTELQETKAVIGETKAKHRHALDDMTRENESKQSLDKSQFGLPDNQRIIDPKKGPVKRTANVRKLPKLPKNPLTRNDRSVDSAR